MGSTGQALCVSCVVSDFGGWTITFYNALTSEFQFTENTMELGTGNATNVDFVIVFKEWHNLDPPHTNLWRGQTEEEGDKGEGVN